MRFKYRPKLLLALLAVFTAAGPIEAHAGLFDWLGFGRRTALYAPAGCDTCSTGRIATTVNSGLVAARPACGACATPVVGAVQATTALSPTAGCCAQTTCCRPQVTCRMVPQTCYRTTYSRVPVTTYRQVTTTDPCTGCPVTCNKPCTTYRWRALRVPYTTYRQVCGTACPTGAAGVSVSSPVVTQGTTGCSNCAQGTTMVAPTTTVAPSTVVSPSTAAPQSTPTVVSPPANQQPATQQPSTGSQMTPVPADQKPRLDVNRPTTESGPVGTGVNTPATSAPYNGGAQNSSTHYAPSSSHGNEQRAEVGTSWQDRLKLLPDPDTEASTHRPLLAPPLLSPDDKTAMRPASQSWNFQRAAWPSNEANVQRVSSVSNSDRDERLVRLPGAEAAPLRGTVVNSNSPQSGSYPSSSDQWDDSGWRASGQ